MPRKFYEETKSGRYDAGKNLASDDCLDSFVEIIVSRNQFGDVIAISLESVQMESRFLTILPDVPRWRRSRRLQTERPVSAKNVAKAWHFFSYSRQQAPSANSNRTGPFDSHVINFD